MTNVNIENFNVNYKLNLIPNEGAQMLIFDWKLPIQNVVLQSKQNLEILQVKDNIAKISMMESTDDPEILCLAHLSIEGDDEHNFHNKIEIKIRTSEGQ